MWGKESFTLIEFLCVLFIISVTVVFCSVHYELATERTKGFHAIKKLISLYRAVGGLGDDEKGFSGFDALDIAGYGLEGRQKFTAYDEDFVYHLSDTVLTACRGNRPGVCGSSSSPEYYRYLLSVYRTSSGNTFQSEDIICRCKPADRICKVLGGELLGSLSGAKVSWYILRRKE